MKVAASPVTLGALRGGFKKFSAYLGGVMGADAYQRYLEFHQEAQCSGEPLTEREFWRDKTARQEANPEGRCC
ncbi:YbdD/YjiX family protein [Pseudarthrobacter sp. J1738]|uniref:YbdD/YjiX family protein n=1 Tax=unclassified Pseudarthrobacter TaxID=2647000 RepID=UPI003D2E7A37